jgi:aspartyl-tRNA(Asn)/glutamyl-tRNA(Gln) amidotransferase subunit A
LESVPGAKINELLSFDIHHVASLIRTRKISPVELLEAALRRIEAFNPELNAFITVVGEQARDAARKAEREILRKRYRGPLHGIPIALKDNIETKGLRTTAGSKILADFLPDADADVVRALRRAGAVIVGKTNLHEFAYGITTENPHYGPTRNPWDLERVAGGSSGGSAVAVATGMAFAAIGTDTGGSIRIPASLCGIIGLKPTYGRVSCRGVIPLSRSLDHVGPLARSVPDAALLLEVLSDTRHPFRSPFLTWTSSTRTSRRAKLKKITLGRPIEFLFDRVNEEVQSAIEATINLFEKAGARIVEISLPNASKWGEAGTQIALAEARRYHESQGYYPTRAEDYGDDVRKRLEQGATVRAIDYLQAMETREFAAAEFDAAFGRADVIVAPATPIAATRIGESIVNIGGEEETVRSAMVRLSRPANLSGAPALSIPCAWTKNGLPIGLQLIGKRWDEARLLQIADAAAEELSEVVPAGFKASRKFAPNRPGD